jgi:hypothetical protein
MRPKSRVLTLFSSCPAGGGGGKVASLTEAWGGIPYRMPIQELLSFESLSFPAAETY